MTQIATTRAYTFCSLGPVIEGNFADDYIQGSGLVKTRGQVRLSGVFKPDVGTVVEFAYQSGSTLSRLPRKLRVLSSFADPFSRTTTVQLGCKLTYLEGRKPPTQNPNTKQEHADVPCIVFQVATLNISAAYVFQQCLDALELECDSVPLTNTFATEEFDLSPGYIQVMSDLLASECYLGYLDEREYLVIRSLNDDSGTGPVLDERSIISIGPIGVGELPGESVAVSYTTQRLKTPDGNVTTASDNWEEDIYIPAATSVTAIEPDGASTVEVTYTFTEWQRTQTEYDGLDRVVTRIEESNGLYGITTSINTKTYPFIWLANDWPCGVGELSGEVFARVPLDLSGVDFSTPSAESTVVTGPEALIIDACNFPPDTFPTIAGKPRDPVTLRVTEVFYEKDDRAGVTKTRTFSKVPWVFTSAGAAAISARAQLAATEEEITAVIDAASVLVESENTLASSKVRIRSEEEFGLERRPSQADRNAAANAKEPPTEGVAELEWIMGSSDSTLTTEFTLPYAPDDTIAWTALGGYTSTPSDAAAKANAYGRVQNRLLLGNRQGLSLQVPHGLLPPRPFDPIYITAEGLTGQYRVNGASYTFDANGLIASCDALFWGGVGEE